MFTSLLGGFSGCKTPKTNDNLTYTVWLNGYEPHEYMFVDDVKARHSPNCKYCQMKEDKEDKEE